MLDQEGYLHTSSIYPLPVLMAWATHENKTGEKLRCYKHVPGHAPATIEAERLLNELNQEELIDLLKSVIPPSGSTIN